MLVLAFDRFVDRQWHFLPPKIVFPGVNIPGTWDIAHVPGGIFGETLSFRKQKGDGLEEAHRSGTLHRLDAAVSVELAIDALEMIANRPYGDHERIGNLIR